MSSDRVLPPLSDQEILAISYVLIDHAADPDKPEFGYVPYPPSGTGVYIVDMLDAMMEPELIKELDIDIEALMHRILAYTEAELVAIKKMVAISRQVRDDGYGQELVLAAIRSELSPTAHECIQYKCRIQVLVDEMMP